MKVFIIAFFALGLAACSDAPTTTRILADQGFTNIKTTGFSWLSCGREDAFATGFTATSPTGKPVKGVVCSGWFKGGTVRFF